MNFLLRYIPLVLLPLGATLVSLEIERGHEVEYKVPLEQHPWEESPKRPLESDQKPSGLPSPELPLPEQPIQPPSTLQPPETSSSTVSREEAEVSPASWLNRLQNWIATLIEKIKNLGRKVPSEIVNDAEVIRKKMSSTIEAIESANKKLEEFTGITGLLNMTEVNAQAKIDTLRAKYNDELRTLRANRLGKPFDLNDFTRDIGDHLESIMEIVKTRPEEIAIQDIQYQIFTYIENNYSLPPLNEKSPEFSALNNAIETSLGQPLATLREARMKYTVEHSRENLELLENALSAIDKAYQELKLSLKKIVSPLNRLGTSLNKNNATYHAQQIREKESKIEQEFTAINEQIRQQYTENAQQYGRLVDEIKALQIKLDELRRESGSQF